MAMKWYGPQAEKYVHTKMGRRVEKAGHMVRDHIREKLSRDQPVKIYGKRGSRSRKGLDPSTSGEYPKKVTGHLRRNVQTEYDPTFNVARVGTNVIYGKYLELGTRNMKGRRPWLSKALMETQNRIRSLLQRGG